MPQLLYEKHNIQIYTCEYVQIFCNQRDGNFEKLSNNVKILRENEEHGTCIEKDLHILLTLDRPFPIFLG